MAALLNGASPLSAFARWSGARDIATLLAEAEAGFKGPSHLLALPYLYGERTPHNDPLARAAIVGLSRFHTAAHITRAALEAICYQTRDVVEAMAQDSGTALDCLQVDGGVTANALCMQLQADILGVPVSRPAVAETTALGAAYAAGLAVGFWASLDDLRANRHEDRRWQPSWTPARRADGITRWRAAIDRTLGWVSLTEEGPR